MKKMLSIIFRSFVASILIGFLLRCTGWNQTRVEEKYGPPVNKEIVDDKTVYHYYYLGRNQACLELTFDKGGKLVNKKEYYGERCNSEQIDSWLKISGNEPPSIDITGRWHDTQGSGFFGWGEGYLRQEENKIKGAIGGYDIQGVVSGKIVYLVFLSGGAVYYRARLEMSEDLLIGNYFGNEREQTKGNSMSLEKKVRGTK